MLLKVEMKLELLRVFICVEVTVDVVTTTCVELPDVTVLVNVVRNVTRLPVSVVSLREEVTEGVATTPVSVVLPEGTPPVGNVYEPAEVAEENSVWFVDAEDS